MTPTLRQCLLAEVLGTAFLLIFGTGAVVVDEQTHTIGHGRIAAAFGLIVLVIIQSLGHVSGAHINPAVTIGFWAAGRFPGRRVLPYASPTWLVSSSVSCFRAAGCCPTCWRSCSGRFWAAGWCGCWHLPARY